MITYQQILDLYTGLYATPPPDNGPAAYLWRLRQAALAELLDEYRPQPSTAYGIMQTLPFPYSSPRTSSAYGLLQTLPASPYDAVIGTETPKFGSLFAYIEPGEYFRRHDARYDELPNPFVETWVRPGWTRDEVFERPIDVATVTGELL